MLRLYYEFMINSLKSFGGFKILVGLFLKIINQFIKIELAGKLRN